MIRRVVFTPLASADIEAGFLWYESQRTGMGAHFQAALDHLWPLLRQFPHAGPAVHGEVRRVLVPHFPYAVYYCLTPEAIEIRACLDQRMEPQAVHRRTEV